ncbi:50S ribosomal protein L14e [Candidatus Woesearchaeota archaeon]|nr:50S ribosomal protein L14e [Candidatus Woesearchaeota archaeon]
MVEVGSVAIKIAGRDAGQLCVVVDLLDSVFVLVDGLTRKRKCNIKHLEFLDKKVKIKKNSSHEDVVKSLKDLGFEILEVKKGKKKEHKGKPKRLRKSNKQKEPSVANSNKKVANKR